MNRGHDLPGATPTFAVEIDWGSPAFRFSPVNERARELCADGLPLLGLEELPVEVDGSLRQLEGELGDWHDTALNWDYPPDPGPWRQAECDAFNAALERFVESLQKAVGPHLAIVDRTTRESEDPDLDRYLRDPKSFQR